MSQLQRSSRRVRRGHGGGSSDSIALAVVLYIVYFIPSFNIFAVIAALFLQSSTNSLTATHSAFIVRLFLVTLLYVVVVVLVLFILPETAALIAAVALVLWFYGRMIMGVVALFQRQEHVGFRWL